MRKLLVASLALNLLAAAAVGALFLTPVQLRIGGRFLDPMREQRATFFTASPLDAGAVVFLGDSITAGGQWDELFPGVAARNRGIGGDTTAQVLARLEPVIAGRPAKVFLLIGTNDLHRGVAEDEIVANTREILARLRSGSPETRLYLQSVLPRAAEYRARVESLNARLAVLAREAGAEFIDLYPHFLDSDGSIRDALSNDELHLLGAGYLLWRERIDAEVRA